MICAKCKDEFSQDEMKKVEVTVTVDGIETKSEFAMVCEDCAHDVERSVFYMFYDM